MAVPQYHLAGSSFHPMSRHQRKEFDRAARIARNEAKHAEQFPSKLDKAKAEMARLVEIAALAALQTAEKLVEARDRTSGRIEVAKARRRELANGVDHAY